MRKPDFFDVTEKGKKLILADMLKLYIRDLGFYIYRKNADPDNYGLVFIKNGIISYVDTKCIKDAVNHEIKKLNDSFLYNLVNVGKDFFSMKFLNGLQLIDPEFLKDNANYCYFTTKESITAVDSEAQTTENYGAIPDLVWRSNIIDKTLGYKASDKPGYFEKFVSRIAGSDFESLKSIIGYLLHTHKSPSSAKAVILFDANTDQTDGIPQGGTGKSLLIDAIGQLRKIAKIPGTRLDFSKQFVFQEITEHTQLALIDEPNVNFKLEKMFTVISGGITIERKGKPSEYISFQDTPKFVITSNHRITGTGDSHDRRKIEFAVSDYYSLEKTPRDEFDKDFFSPEWTQQDWNAFFSFMCECVALYLKNGVIQQTNADTRDLKIMTETSPDCFHFWISDGNFDEFKRQEMIAPRQYLDQFRADYDFDYNYGVREFMRDLKIICRITKTKIIQTGKGVNLRIKYEKK